MNSLYEFFAMDGYAFYVWCSYIAVFFVFILHIGLAIRAKRVILQQLKMQQTEERTGKFTLSGG